MPFDLMIVLPPDTNPKNLELAPSQSIMATRLDQLVYSPNYYIQIFRLNLWPAVRIEPSTARSKLKSNVLTDCAMGAMLNSEITSLIQTHTSDKWKEHLDTHWDHRHNTHCVSYSMKDNRRISQQNTNTTPKQHNHFQREDSHLTHTDSKRIQQTNHQHKTQKLADT